jgi:hypothetical protein
VVEHSERESHLTLPLDALQWTILCGVTIQHQNRQIKITHRPWAIDGGQTSQQPSQLSHQTLRGFGSTLISGRALLISPRAAGTRNPRFFSIESLACEARSPSACAARNMGTNTHTHHAQGTRRSAEHARDTTDVNRVVAIASSMASGGRRVGVLVGRLAAISHPFGGSVCREANAKTSATFFSSILATACLLLPSM